MSTSSLVSYTKISPNKSKGRGECSISRISIHCAVGQLSVEKLGAIFAPTSRGASCQYGIGFDGRVGNYCSESDRSWCTSSKDNDNKAITIECACDAEHPYAINTKVYNTLIALCADICKRNGKTKLLWINDKNKALNYKPASNEMIITVHRWFAAKACPGDYIYNRLGQIADDVNKALQNDKATVVPTVKKETKIMYKTIDDIPNYGKEAVTWAVDKGILKGDNGNFNLSEDLLRCLVFIYRANK